MQKSEVIDTIIAELQSHFVIHISEEFPDPSYLDIYHSHTVQKSGEQSYELKTVSSDNDAGSLPSTNTSTFDEVALKKWLGGIDERFLSEACVEEVKHGPFRLLFPTKKA